MTAPVVVGWCELSPYREVHALRVRVNELLERHPPADLQLPGQSLERRLWVTANAAARSVSEAMRSPTPRDQVAHLRDADFALSVLRGLAFDAFELAGWPAEAFDEVSVGVARALREVLSCEVSVRRHARLLVEAA